MRPHDLAANQAVLGYLGQGSAPDEVEVRSPPDDVDTWRLGAHPDVVDRLWHQLAGSGHGQPVLAGHTAAVLDLRSGLIVAVALGTQYAIRVSDPWLATALEAGYEAVHRFGTVGRTMDLKATFGPNWVFGRYDEREPGWLW